MRADVDTLRNLNYYIFVSVYTSLMQEYFKTSIRWEDIR